MAFPLTKEQRDIVTDRGGELLVSAAAGSGKTRVLVERLLDRVTGEGLDIDRFLVITYTKAAAAELRERIAQELTDRLAQAPGDRHLRRQTTLVYQAQISTIHAFCSKLLRESGYLLDLDPDFRLCDEIEGNVLMRQTLESLIDSRYEGLLPDSSFAQLSDTLGAGRDDSRLVEIVLDIFSRVQSHADPTCWLKQQRELWGLSDAEDLTDTSWGALLLEEASMQADYWYRQLSAFLPEVDADELLSLNYGDSLRGTLAALERLAQASDWDEAYRCLPVSFPRVGTKRKRKGEVPLWEEERAAQCAQRIKLLRERCKKNMEKIAEQFSGSSDVLLSELRLSSVPMQELIDLVLEFQDAYAAEKKRRALLDFGDLEHFAVKLLCDADGRPSALAQSWSTRYDEVLVDEYQDTNQVQNAIFTAISDCGRKLVQVGDVKQSIYRFRLADPTIFLQKYARFGSGEEAAWGEPRLRLLSKNFRSRTQVLEGCNDLFRAIMSTRLGELEYTDDQALVPGAAFPEGDNYALELDILALNRDQEETGPETTNRPGRDLLEARFTAARIREMLDEPFMISDGDKLRPVRPSDIMVLLRSPGTVIHQYIRAFGEQGIPWAAEGSGDFFDTPEIHAAMSILKIVDNPRQDVPLIAALRSPVFDFSANQLAYLRGENGGDFYGALCAAAERGDEASADFLAQLEHLRSGSTDMTTGQLVWYIYEKTNLLGIFGAMENGAVRQENLLSLYSLAQQMEGSGCRTLFQFLLRLDRLQQSGGKLKTAGSGIEGEGVSIMSIHRSKGLEKPVVFVCGLTKQMNKIDLTRPVLFHPTLGIGPKGLDRERRVEYSTVARRAVSRALERELLSEELRLLYVAMTRAREKLILTLALKDAEKTMNDLVELLEEKPAPELLEQQPTVGHWVLLHALTRAEAGNVDEIRMLGERRPSISYGPAWDIRWARGEDYVNVSRRSEKKRKAEMLDADLLAERFRALSWQYPTPAPANIPSKLTATQIKGRVLDQEITEGAPAQEAEKCPVYRPNFIVEHRGLTAAQRGTALHLVMEKLDLHGDLTPAGIRKQMDEMLNADLLTAAQRDCIPVQEIAQFFSGHVGERLTRSKTCRREFKFSLLVDAEAYFADAHGEEVLLQGVIDLWFEDEDGVTVVDFKSDHIQPGEERERAEYYRPQLEAYSKALKTILGVKKLKTVLWFFKTARAVEL